MAQAADIPRWKGLSDQSATAVQLEPNRKTCQSLDSQDNKKLQQMRQIGPLAGLARDEDMLGTHILCARYIGRGHGMHGSPASGMKIRMCVIEEELQSVTSHSL